MPIPYVKYGNKKVACRQLGTVCRFKHDSKIEAQRCDLLAIRKRQGVIEDYKSQVKYPLVVNGLLICNHILDFEVIKDGELFVEDVKGMALPDWKLKYKLFHACYPNIKYIVNFGGTFKEGKLPVIKKMKEVPAKQEELNL